jgi:SdrD B-like domain/Bacterial Ig domain
VTGTGTTASSGGTIQNTTGDGISLTNTQDVTLSNMNINGADGNGIFGSGLNGIVLTGLSLSGNADAQSEAGILLNELTGDATHVTTFSNLSVANSGAPNVHILNTGGSLANLVVTDSTFSNNGAGPNPSSAGFIFESGTAGVAGTPTMKITATHNTFSGNNANFTGPGLFISANDGTVNARIGDGTVGGQNTFNNNFVGLNLAQSSNAGAGTGGNLNFTVDNNIITNSDSNAINVFSSGDLARTLDGIIEHNVIGTQGLATSGSRTGAGIRFGHESIGVAKVLIDGNIIQSIGVTGISGSENIQLTQLVQPGTVHATITNNTLRDNADSRAVTITATLSGAVINADVHGNTISNVNNANFIRFIADGLGSADGTINVPQANDAAIEAANGGATALEDARTFFNQAIPLLPSATPLLAAPGGVQAVQWHVAGVGDFNGDGLADALVQRDDGLLGIGTINGDPATTLGQLGAGWSITGIGDVNSDGTSDILLKNDSGIYQADLIRNNAVAGTVDLVLVDGELRAAPAPGPDAPPSDPAPVDPTPVKPAPAEPPVQPASGTVETHLTQAELDGIVSAAIARWSATGLTTAQIDALKAMSFGVADLSGLNLGAFTPAQITLDADAAGHGWYLDGTPRDDAEFGNAQSATRLTTDPTGAPAGHYDLLTTVMHEMGHALGLEDHYEGTARDALMYGWLFTGERRLPGAGEADGAVAGSITTEAFAGSPISVSPTDSTTGAFTLPAGAGNKTVSIQWQATVDPQSNQLIDNPQNTGTVSATNTPPAFPDANTNTVTTALDTLILGGTIWNDNGAGGGTAANGIKDGTEPGVSGVALSLFVDSDDNNLPDTPGTPLVTGVVTNASGDYSFTGLAPGNYIVRVDAGNFAGAGALASLQVSPVTTPDFPDPDNNVDNDDNGGPHGIGQASLSNAITLDYNSEPTPGTGNDTNNTLDFGFFNNPSPDLSNLTNMVAFTEGDAPILLDTAPAATVTDDQANLSGGSLTAAITLNKAAAEDVLGFSIAPATTVTLTSGTSVGSTVSVGGVAIGTIAAGGTGTGADNLIVTFNGNATPALVSTLIQALTYFDSSVDNPTPGQRTIAVTVDDGLGGTDSENVQVTVIAIDDPTVLKDDAVATTENAVLNGSVFADNGSGPDSDPDTPLVVSAVNGNAGNVNNPILLASGALLTVNANGSFTYDPNGAFDHLPAPGSGASNVSATDTFTYTVTPTANVTVTVTGVDSDDTLIGAAGIDSLSGGIGNDTYFVGDPGDVVNEAVGAGYDIVAATVDYILPDNVEALYLIGAGLTATGSGNADSLLSSGGPNFLVGLLGDDLYYVNTIGDIVTETVGEGYDTVVATLNYLMPLEVEALYVSGTGLTGTGTGGANTLLSVGGANILVGLGGDDLYVVNNSGDTVTETVGAGYDTVVATSSYVMPFEVEALYMNGAGLTGTGTGGANTLLSIGGANILVGLGGDDLYYVKSGDTVTETVGEGYDTVVATSSYVMPAEVEALYMNGTGLTGTGTGGANTLLSIGGANILVGLGGDDVYVVNNILDTVTETVGAGYDTVFATSSYVMPAEVEALYMNGAGLTGTGTGGANTLISIGGANILDGLGGDDVYVVNNSADQVVEAANGGYDTVMASVSFDLSTNVEAMYLTGSGLTGNGNSGANTLVTIGANILVGEDGSDMFVLLADSAEGATIDDLDGNEGDVLVFSGFGIVADGARFDPMGANQWQITSGLDAHTETITLANGAVPQAGDFFFV